MADLTPKQELFVREYLIDFNATQAAIRAGYSPRTAKVIGCENLTKPDIEARIAELKQKRAEKLELTADHFAQRLERIAAAAAQTAVEAQEQADGSTLDRLVSKEAADVARACSMDTAKLLGLVVEKRETTVFQHEDRLAIAKERANAGRRPTAH